MESLPTNLVNSLPAALVTEAESWWQGLPVDDREELTLLCDSRKELFLFETFSDGDEGPKVTGGKFIPHDDAFGFDEWGEDYFQHLLDHPELVLAYNPERRIFHIGCSRHIDARRCFVEGKITQLFACPFKLDSCLMHKILGDKTSIKLRPIHK